MLTLRSIERDDLDFLREHRNRADTRCWLGDASQITEAAQLAWWLNGNRAGYKIASLGDIEIGLVRVTHVSAADGTACVGGDVFADRRGFGNGYRVFAAACELAAEMGAKRLWLRVFLENVPAVKVYQRAGFVFDPNADVTTLCRELPSTVVSGVGMVGITTPTLLHYVKMTRG